MKLKLCSPRPSRAFTSRSGRRARRRGGSDMTLLKRMYPSWHITNPKEPDEKIAGIKMVVNTSFSYHRT
ncbi:hypothetical protein [Pontibacter harenae]|uniref:hypothetical protein n=1 Tax=Pontibacter harenae TaxID=2894083 RepID=UPI001E39F2E9|nr:hypothetical protein [Pontibacter harenae]MCC9168403.1 hypothetical protein [Pontibacter harenae]